VIIFILLIALTTVFVGSEFALVKIRATRIEQLADEGNTLIFTNANSEPTNTVVNAINRINIIKLIMVEVSN
jgi:CBS domain containing-hemolysin-like protein